MNAHFNFIRFFLNSIVITVVITLIVIYTSTICGFVLSKYKFKGRNILFGFVLSTMMIPWCVTIIPKYSMIQAFGWMDSYKALIIPAMFSGFGIFMMKRRYLRTSGRDPEAARIDGANEFYIFHKIVLPMSKNWNLQYCDLPVPLDMGGFPVAILGNYKQRQTASCRWS